MLILVYVLAKDHVIGQVEKRVRDTMLECRAFHHYVQRNMHPAYYKLVKDGRLPQGFYAPELLSSSYIARTFQQHYNEERRKAGLPEVRYKMAAIDPRNAVNEANAFERDLIVWFNEDKTRMSHREIVQEEGQDYLLYARPFLAVQPRCLKCHGRPEEAPAELRDGYQWTGGWDRKVGDIVAAEIVRSPLEGEYDAAMAVTGGAALLVGAGLILVAFNTRLRTLVARRTKHLQEGEQMLAESQQIAHVGSYRLELPSKELAWSDELFRIFGYEPGALTPTFDLVGSHVHPEDRERWDDANERFFAGEAPYNHEYRIVLRDGTVRTLHSSALLQRDREGTPVRMIGAAQDVTEARQSEAQRRELETQLRQQQKLESIGTLAGGVAHEINNPINGIMNYAQLIKDDLEDDGPIVELADEIIVETKRVATIVRNLLAFARPEKQAHSPAEMCDIVEATLSLVHTVIRHDQITFEADVPGDLPKVKCRSQQIQQVLMNLLTNARDALNERYPEHDSNKIIRLSARVIEKEGKPWIRTTVEDRGVGIDPEIQDRIFDPFFTTKGRDRGTGLGLSISHGIAREHHGELRVESKPGEYTRFHLELPVDSGWELATREDAGE